MTEKTDDHAALVACICRVMDRNGGHGSYSAMADEILLEGFRRPQAAVAATNDTDRVQTLIARAYGKDTSHDRQFAPFVGLARRYAWRCISNKAETPRAVYDAVCSGAVRSWRNVGDVGIRAICAWIAQQFPTDPAPTAPANDSPTDGH